MGWLIWQPLSSRCICRGVWVTGNHFKLSSPLLFGLYRAPFSALLWWTSHTLSPASSTPALCQTVIIVHLAMWAPWALPLLTSPPYAFQYPFFIAPAPVSTSMPQSHAVSPSSCCVFCLPSSTAHSRTSWALLSFQFKCFFSHCLVEVFLRIENLWEHDKAVSWLIAATFSIYSHC